jgi:hypothetical protein
VFAGHEQQYIAEFCERFPDSEFCKIPEPPTILRNEAL